MKEIAFNVLGLGAWGPRFRNWSDLEALLAGEQIEDDGAKGPKPQVIPANERRRAPLPVRLAVETSSQACLAAGIDAKDLACVFVSGLGDTQLTDYMCKVLASENKALSPTKFHNSVHNAAAGYWTISTGCTKAANSIAGFEESVSLTLMEALIQAEAEQRALLLCFYDAPVSSVLKELLKNQHPFAVSVIIAPASVAGTQGVAMRASIEQRAVAWPVGRWTNELQECYTSNPVARILPLLDVINATENPVSMPLSVATSLTITRVG